MSSPDDAPPAELLRLRASIDNVMDKRITKEVNKAGFMMA